MKQKILPYVFIFLLTGGAFAFIAPSVDWYGTPKLEDLATKSANDFYTKLSAGEYQTIYVQADEELKNKTTESDFQNSLQTTGSKLSNSPLPERTKCIGIGADSMWDRIKVLSGYSAKIKANCFIHTGGESFGGKFVWRYINGELKLVSFAEKEKVQ